MEIIKSCRLVSREITGNKIFGPEALNNCILIFTFMVLLFSGCRSEIIPEEFLPRNEYESYLHSLVQANLDGTALGKDWVESGENALLRSFDVSLPFHEELYIDPAKAEAVGYRFFVLRGLRIEIEINVHSTDSMKIFADLFRQSGDSIPEWTHVASAGRDTLHLEFEPRMDAPYVFRLQPELLRGGRFSILIREVPSIGFPVTGKNRQSIWSFFDDPRYGGTVKHNGVDIFAARHTPVVAPSDAEVSRVGEGEIGGKYVWLRDRERSMNMYFAHLQTQEVMPGDIVAKGQVIGTIGNSGNAITTPPHLHFGIYSRGPIDPFHFIVETDTIPSGISGDTLLLGELARSNRTVIVRSSPGSRGHVVDTLEPQSVLKIKALTGNLCRVELPDGSSGYIPGSYVETIRDVIREQVISETIGLLDTPGINAVCVGNINPGDKFSVLGKYKKYVFGKTLEETSGWILVP